MTKRVSRHITKPPDPNKHVGIADGGAEQCLLDGNVWSTLKPTAKYVNLLGPLAGRHAGEIFQVVSAVTKLIDENGKAYCAIIHEGLLDTARDQRETLL